MRGRLVVVVVALCATVGLLASVPAEAATVSVAISGFSFKPDVIKATQGSSVKWNQQDPGQHTTTSNELFWQSAHLSTGASFIDVAKYAGIFAYHCEIHTFMTGQVRVPIIVTASAAGGWIVRWSSLNTTPTDRNFDIQIKRPGSNKWRPFRDATTRAFARFDTSVAGEYRFRARTRNLTIGQPSAWSPAVALTIT